jgi:nicotinate phosphoribosyltransferase
MPGIVRSLLDLDYYKFTMAQVAFKRFRDAHVAFAFANRTKAISLPDFIEEEELRAELERVQTLTFTPAELDFLRESRYVRPGLFSQEFLSFLAAVQLPDVELATTASTLEIEVSGPWPETTLWETLILCILSELYGRSLLRRRGMTVEDARSEGSRRLAAKIELIKEDPRVRFSDFGTRRRFSRDWHREVIETLARELPGQFLGTSNVLLAKELSLRPIGTFAHEMDMVFSGIFHESDDEIRASHNKVLEAWWEQYGEEISIALTDTYGTDFFFQDFTPKQARAWRGLRHDSGDPFAFGEKAIAFYEGLGIDPTTKQIVFSDGMEAETMLRLVDRFADRIQVVFGWGTNLTNDVGFDPLSMVVKVVRSCGHGTVKLCDNFDKAVGSPHDIERFKRIFGRTEIPRLGVKY